MNTVGIGEYESANDGGNGTAAKRVSFQNRRHRRLSFTAWLGLFVELADFYSAGIAPEFPVAKLPGVCVIVI